LEAAGGCAQGRAGRRTEGIDQSAISEATITPRASTRGLPPDSGVDRHPSWDFKFTTMDRRMALETASIFETLFHGKKDPKAC